MKFFGSLMLASTFLFIGCSKGSQETAAPTSEQAAAAPAASTGNSTITGRIKFTGTAPKAKKIMMTADAFCKTEHVSVDSEEVVVNPNKTLKFVYVFVKSGLGDKKFPPSTEPVVLDQHGCMYQPHVIAVQAGHA